MPYSAPRLCRKDKAEKNGFMCDFSQEKKSFLTKLQRGTDAAYPNGSDAS